MAVHCCEKLVDKLLCCYACGIVGCESCVSMLHSDSTHSVVTETTEKLIQKISNRKKELIKTKYYDMVKEFEKSNKNIKKLLDVAKKRISEWYKKDLDEITEFIKDGLKDIENFIDTLSKRSNPKKIPKLVLTEIGKREARVKEIITLINESYKLLMKELENNPEIVSKILRTILLILGVKDTNTYNHRTFSEELRKEINLLESKTNALGEYEFKIKEKQILIEEYQILYTDLKRDFEDEQKRLTDLLTLLKQQVKEEEDKLDNDIKAKREGLRCLEEKVEYAEERLFEITKKHSGLEMKVSYLEIIIKDLERNKARHANSVTNLIKEQETLKETIKKEEKQLSKLTSDYFKGKNEYNILVENKAKIEEQYKTSEENIEREITSKNSTLSELEEEVSKKSKQVEDLDCEIQELEAKYKEIHKAFTDEATKIQEYTNKYINLNSQYNDKVRELDVTINNWHKLINDKSREKNLYQREIENLKKEETKLNKSLLHPKVVLNLHESNTRKSSIVINSKTKTQIINELILKGDLLSPNIKSLMVAEVIAFNKMFDTSENLIATLKSSFGSGYKEIYIEDELSLFSKEVVNVIKSEALKLNEELKLYIKTKNPKSLTKLADKLKTNSSKLKLVIIQ